MSEKKFTEGRVSQMPVHSGDGYSWGGDWIVTIDDSAINLGSDAIFGRERGVRGLAHLIASAPGLFAACEKLVASYDPETGWYVLGALYEAREAAVAAVSKAKGESE